MGLVPVRPYGRQGIFVHVNYGDWLLYLYLWANRWITNATPLSSSNIIQRPYYGLTFPDAGGTVYFALHILTIRIFG
jgi:hypothetical protein